MSPSPVVALADSRLERPAVEELLGRARSFRAELLVAGARTESERRVSSEVMDRLTDAGLTLISRSKIYGGYGYGPSMLVRLGYELGQGCGSTAWCANLANCNSWFASYWPKEAQDEIWQKTPRNMVVGTVLPTGKCETAPGGFKIWGLWPFASNCDNSQWAFVAANVPEVNGRQPGVCWFLLPTTELSIDQKSWVVSGMQGTGSKTLVAHEPVFVPAHRVIYYDDIAERKTPGFAVPGNTPAGFAFSTFGATALAGPILGMAQGALNLFIAATREKLRLTMRPGMTVPAGQSPFVQERIGRSQAMIRAALASLVQTLEGVEAKIFAGEAPSLDDRILVRAAIVASVRQAVDATNAFVEAAGAAAADSTLPLQRFWRDINAASRHVSFDAPAAFSMSGQHLLGLQPLGTH